MRIREIATGLQFPEGPVAMADGSVLVVEIARGTLSRVMPDGRIHVVARTGGGPNGAAMGPDGAVYICNNGGFRWHTEPDGIVRPTGEAVDYSGGRIERVDLNTGKVERLYERIEGLDLRGPNDLVFDAHGGFYFTDLGKIRDTQMDRGAVYYGRHDAAAASVVARPVMTPNGIGLSRDGGTLYYAETEGARVWSFEILAPGLVRKAPWPSPHGGAMLVASPGGQFQRFDSLALDERGALCVATLIHGGISVISAEGVLEQHVPLPDPFTTNICFGGPGRRTAFVTLSGSGRLIAIEDWPFAGLQLAYEA